MFFKKSHSQAFQDVLRENFNHSIDNLDKLKIVKIRKKNSSPLCFESFDHEAGGKK